jgi:hypothetical protein
MVVIVFCLWLAEKWKVFKLGKRIDKVELSFVKVLDLRQQRETRFSAEFDVSEPHFLERGREGLKD